MGGRAQRLPRRRCSNCGSVKSQGPSVDTNSVLKLDDPEQRFFNDHWVTLRADRLVEALDEAAEREPDEQRKGFLSKAASYLGNAGGDLAVEIGATAINRQMGM